MTVKIHEQKHVDIDKLKNHPKNYREHPEDQLQHLMKSIEQQGFYRNIVVAKDYTILAGHGVVKASRKLGLKEVPVVRLDIDANSTKALKVLAGDNELGRLAEVDDRELSKILKEILEMDVEGLLGTGYDEMMLANLVMVTRPSSEIASIKEAAEWIGMPDYEPKENALRINIQFRNAEDRDKFAEISGMNAGKSDGLTWSYWWPHREKEDLKSVKYEA